jgi:hypothetical protein
MSSLAIVFLALSACGGGGTGSAGSSGPLPVTGPTSPSASAPTAPGATPAPPGATPTTPATTPTAKPTATPPATSGSSSVSLSLSSLSFAAIGAAAAQTILVSEKNYTGTFTVTGCSGTAQAQDLGANKFQITPLQAGACSMTWTDTAGRKAALAVTVTTTQVTIQT